MNLQELDDFRLADAVKFHGQLNTALFNDDRLREDVRDQLLEIARDFMAHLGVKDLDVKDITLSGSNAAFTYTPHSDIDLHILVDIASLKNDDVYRELFTSKKIVYNDTHDIKIHGYDVELYVQDWAEPVKSLGEYSVLNNKWIKYPAKKRANFDERGAREKFKKLIQLSELALRSKNLDRLEHLLQTIHKYRRAGLSEFGEFGAENLAYKALRSRGVLDQLYKHRDQLHSASLSLDESGMLNTPTLSPHELALKHGVSKDKILQHLLKGVVVELAHTDDSSAARAKALDNLSGNLYYYENDVDEDFDPNGPPPGPEFKPTMPKGTVRVDVSDVYDWYKLGQHVSNLKGLGKHDFGKGPPSTIMAFGDEDTEHKYIKGLEKTGLSTTDIDPVDPKQPKGMKRQKVDTTFNVNEETGKKSAIYSTDVYGATAYHSKCLEKGCDWESKRYDSIKLAQNAAQKHAQKHFKKDVTEASGYIPSEKEKNDPRFKTALTVDVKPDSIKKNAKKLGLGNIARAGIPPTANTNGSV